MRSLILNLMLCATLVALAACARAPIPSADVEPTLSSVAAPLPTRAAPTGTPQPASPTARAKVLRVNLGLRPESLDPQRAATSTELAILQLVYEGLTRLDEKGAVLPGAADKWEFTSDKTLAFHLRPGLKRADGTALTARDFELAYKRTLDPRLGAPYPSLLDDAQNALAAYTFDPQARAEDIERHLASVGIKALDDHTLGVWLNQPANYWLTLAALWVGFPADARKIENEPDTWWLKPENHNSNGPFKFVEIRDEVIKLAPNPNYWGGAPKIDRIEFYWIVDAAAVDSYRNGELDVIRVTPDNVGVAQADPRLSQELVRLPAARVTYLGFNLKRAPFSDKVVRKAFSQALDRDGLVRDALKGLGKPQLSWIPPGVRGYDETATVPGFNAQAAAQTLLDGGYGTPDKKRIDCAKLGALKLTFANTPRAQTLFQTLAGNLTRVFACPVALEPVEPNAYSTFIRDPKTTPQVYLLSWEQEYPHPQNWLFLHACGGVFAARLGYCNRDFDAAFTAANQELDADKALAKYQAAQKIFVNDLAGAFLWHNENAFLVKPYVLGWRERAGASDSVLPGQFAAPLTFDIDLARVGASYPGR